MDGKGLLFVHKSTSSTSLSRGSNQKEVQDINRHVQRGRKHERYKKLDVQKWHRPFLTRRKTNPPSAQIEAVHSQASMKSTSSLRSASETSIQFIRYNPIEAAPEDHHAIRSNAVRYQWERSREVRPQGRKSKVPADRDREKQIKELHPKMTDSSAPEPSNLASEDTSLSRKTRDVDDAVQVAQTSTNSGKRSSEDEQLLEIPSPDRSSSLQPGGYPTDLPPSTVAPLLHLVYIVTNGTFIGDRVPTRSVVAARYVQQMRSHPASFHAAIWVCLKGMVDKSSMNPSTFKQRRFLDVCHNLAVQSVIQMISELCENNYATPSDELGMLCSALQSLALGTTEDLHAHGSRSGPRQSTLTKLQNLHIWGSAPRWLNYHEEAARKILHANDCMDPFWAGLRVCQTQNDIISSCRTLTKPRSPCWFLNLDFPERYHRLMFQMQPGLSPGLMKYAGSLSMRLSGLFMSVVSDLMLYDSIQGALLSNRLAWFGVEYVCDARNWAQHQTVSLPSSEETMTLAQHTQQALLFDTVRYALIVYSLIAVLPLPLSSAPFPELASRLDSNISELVCHGQETLSASLLLWVSSMAALAAIGTSKREHLVTRVAQFCHDLDISDWDSMQLILRDHLWSGEISDFDGIYLFLEVQKYMLEEDSAVPTPEHEINRAIR